MKNLSFAILFALLLISFTKADFYQTIYTATLSPNQIPNQPVQYANQYSIGTSVCVFYRYPPMTLQCDVQHNVEELTNATIYIGQIGETGPALYSFNVDQGTTLSAEWSVVDTGSYSAEDLLDLFLNGMFYVQLDSLDFPHGEIRGQYAHSDRFLAFMTPQQTIPRASGTYARGIALCSYVWGQSILDVDLVHSVTNPTATDIGHGALGQMGSVDDSFSGKSPFQTPISLTVSETDDLFSDLLFLDVRSTNNPNGDIRGQLISIDYVDEGSFSTVLATTQQSSSNDTFSNSLGVALVSYDCTSRLFQYLILHELEEAQAVLFGVSDSDSPGTLLFSAPSGESPIYGGKILDAGEESYLYAETMYISVMTSQYPAGNGAARGVLDGSNSLWAYLTGSSVVPAVSTSSVGLALMSPSEGSVRFILYHNIPQAREVTLMLGNEGTNGGEIWAFDSTSSPLLVLHDVDQDEEQAILDGETYLEIRTASHPFGVVRGQIRALAPCDPNADNVLTVDENSSGELASSEIDFIETNLDDDDDDIVIVYQVLNDASTFSYSYFASALSLILLLLSLF